MSAALAPRPAPTGVSIVLAVRDEAEFVEATVRSLLAQQGDVDIELLAIDGGSADGSRAILARLAAEDGRVRVLDNPRRTAPAAFNLGLAAARHDWLAVFGAHAFYPPDYLATCLAAAREHGAVGCSGGLETRAANASLEARLVAWAMAHPFGSSSRSVRTQPEGESDAAPFGVFETAAVRAAGGWDEALVRNQDNDLWQKLRARGGRLWLTHRTHADYFPRATLAAFARYAWNGGRWNAVSLRRNPRSLRLRHLVPLAFVAALALACGLAALTPLAPVAALPLAALLVAHLGAGLAGALATARRERTWAALLLPPVFLLFHAAYGAGTARGLFAAARSRAAERR